MERFEVFEYRPRCTNKDELKKLPSSARIRLSWIPASRKTLDKKYLLNQKETKCQLIN